MDMTHLPAVPDAVKPAWLVAVAASDWAPILQAAGPQSISGFLVASSYERICQLAIHGLCSVCQNQRFEIAETNLEILRTLRAAVAWPAFGLSGDRAIEILWATNGAPRFIVEGFTTHSWYSVAVEAVRALNTMSIVRGAVTRMLQRKA